MSGAGETFRRGAAVTVKWDEHTKCLAQWLFIMYSVSALNRTVLSGIAPSFPPPPQCEARNMALDLDLVITTVQSWEILVIASFEENTGFRFARVCGS